MYSNELAKFLEENGVKNIYVNSIWRYNDSEKYEYNPKDLSKWKVLDL